MKVLWPDSHRRDWPGGTLTGRQSPVAAMCYEDLRAAEVGDRSMRALLRAERADAVVNGLEAAALVSLLLLWHGVSPDLLAASALAAVPLGAVIHQAVLVVGVLVLRARARPSGRAPASG